MALKDGFEPPPHFYAGSMSRAFADIVSASATKEGRTFNDQLLLLAIVGADCIRIHGKKEAHIRRRKK